MRSIDIAVRQISRVEGHGNLIVKAADGKVKEVKWEVTEAPRFFEIMLRGRPWHDAHVLASRICGICSVSHQLASLQATEAAFGVVPSEQTLLLRRLVYAGEVIESHMLHVCFLAAPDFLGVGSVFPLWETDRETVLRALRLKNLGNEIMARIGGRQVHPQAIQVGHFGRLPTERDLEFLRTRLEGALTELDAIVELFKGLLLPDFSRETEFISLKHPDEYAFIRGDIASTDTGIASPDRYLEIAREYTVPHSTAKFARHARESYAVGALARFNNNSGQLSSRARQAAEVLALKPPCFNPFMNNVAQVVETIHEVEESLEVIDRVMKSGLHREEAHVPVRAGRGVGAVEAPRGLLIHDYTYDEKGFITRANLIIPTNQNHASIQQGLEAFLPALLDREEPEIRRLCEALVRSYDPCISCSTH